MTLVLHSPFHFICGSRKVGALLIVLKFWLLYLGGCAYTAHFSPLSHTLFGILSRGSLTDVQGRYAGVLVQSASLTFPCAPVLPTYTSCLEEGARVPGWDVET